MFIIRFEWNNKIFNGKKKKQIEIELRETIPGFKDFSMI